MLRSLLSNWIGRIRAPRLPTTGGAVALPGLELTLSNDNKTARGMRQTRWSLFTLTAAWAASTDQRRESPTRLSGPSGNSSGYELDQLLAQGHKPIPLQWIEIDKNEHKRREGGPHVAPLIKKSFSQPRRSGGNHWCKNGLSNLRHLRVEPSPVVGFVRAPHGQVGRHHERLPPRASVGTVDLNETTTWRSVGR